MRRIVAELALAGLLLACLPAVAQPVERVQLRATSVLPDEVQRVLFEVAEPVVVSIPGGQEVEPIFRAHCGGSISDILRSQLAALNPGQAALRNQPNERTLRFPPCAKVQARPTYLVQVGDTLELVLGRALGATGSTRLLQCPRGVAEASRCRAIPAAQSVEELNGRRMAGLDRLEPGRVLELPFRSSWTALTVKDGISADRAINDLQIAAATTPAGDDLLHVVKAPELELMAPLASDAPVLQSGPCAASSALPADWPWDRRALRAAIEAATRHRGAEVSRTVVRVADTGVVGLNDPVMFPPGMLAVNRGERDGDRRDNDRRRNGYAGDHFGIDAERGGDVSPRPGHLERLHGTQVADLVLGGRAFRRDFPELGHLIGLNFGRLFTDRGRGGIWVNPATLIASLETFPPDINIVNASVGGSARIDGLEAVMRAMPDRRQMMVIAAGNDGQNLADRPMWPAAFGGDERVRAALLVVGAHGPNGERIRFSNFGSDHVDLLAPGCRISVLADGSETEVNGTSFAAPLVTMVAGLLRSVMPNPDSREIKLRLQASSRWIPDEDIRGVPTRTTRFGGILDAVTALRVFDDVLRLSDGTMLVGRWLTSDQVLSVCADRDPLLARDVLRIRVADRVAAPPMLEVMHRDSQGFLREMRTPCPAAAPDGPVFLVEADDGTRRQQQVPWRQIESLVPAYDLADRRIPAPAAGALQPATTRVALAARMTPQAQMPLPVQMTLPIQMTPPAGQRAPDPNESGRIMEIQRALEARGIGSVVPDGRLGPNTLDAIREFQRSRIEAPTGTLTPRQERALMQGLPRQ
jgi:hypothetical protein